MIKGIIFDMDGVMIDTENQSNLAHRPCLQNQGDRGSYG